SDGSIRVNTTAGTSPFEYSFDGGVTFGESAVLSGQKAGYHRVQVRDVKGCLSSVKGVSLYDPNAPKAPKFVVTDSIYCLNSEPDYALLDSTCKQEGSEFKWFDNPACTGEPIHLGDSMPVKGLTGYTTYYVYQEKAGCKSATSVFKMFVSRPPIITDVATLDPTSCAQADGKITITATGDTTLYYSIELPQEYAEFGNFINLRNGRYPITVKDEAGCVVEGEPAVLEAYDTPEAPTMLSTDTIYCKREPRLDLQAAPINSGKIYWYKNMSYRSAVGSGNKHALTNYTSGDYLFTAMELLSNGCYSKPSDVKVKILDDLKLGLRDTAACLGAEVTLQPAKMPEGSTYLWKPGDYMTETMDVTVQKTPSVYTLTVTDPSYGKYCQTTDTVTVRNGNTPIRTDTTICVGGTVQLDIPDALMIAWSDGAAGGARDVVGVAGLKLYYAEASFRNGCTYEYVFGVTGTQEPAVKIDTTICYGGSIVLDVPVASSLIWKDTSATGKRSVTAILGTKSYTATATLAGGCLRDYIFNVTGTQEAPKVKDTSICVGATIRLEIPEAVSLKWKDTALTTGRDVKVKLGRQSDTATVILEGGCIRDYIFNITGTQEPPLRVDTSVCIGGTLHLDVP
ncbi:MAG: hypothetical protein K2L03_07400, partial [Bacteroidales bacterium]|nr:hypothetical protein [Bacteroidales bacterium]